MRYLNLICSMYSIVIKFVKHIAIVYFLYPVDERVTVKGTAKIWPLLNKRHNACHGLFKKIIGYADSAKLPNFFLRGYVKYNVSRTKLRNITDLKQKITDVIAAIDEAMLQQT